jgi:energy-coupling factor transporter ATP-binding protein EcfA2
MILITRPSQPPAYAERAALGQTALEATAAEGGFKAQRRYAFDSSIWLAARTVLREASYDKCVWCESQAGYAGPAEIDHYRPKHRAEGLGKGEIHPDHYWWLAYSWNNLVFCCQACNRAKRNRFPVIGPRLEPGDPSGAEQPLLLDPYGTDDPSEHLWFEDDGTVRPISDHGDVTIEVLALNRPDLVERRQRAAALTQSVLAAATEPVPADTRAALIDPHVEYVGLRQQLLKRHLARAGTETAAEVLVPKTVATVSSDIGAVWIEEVEIVNFGCFHELELRFSAPGEGYEPWIVVLGANGSGKSTILRAIALALCSADARRRLAPDASKYVNRGTRARRGHVRIRFNQGDELRLEASRGSRHFTVTGQRPKFALAGYGSTRLLPHRTKSASRRATGPQLTNLFDPWASLANTEPWLADPQQVPPDDFRVLASSLKTLMSVEDAIQLSRRSGKMRARMFDTIVDLDELSDGYQSILALSLDLCLAFGSEREQGLSTENFEGMVLIDELEVHLHPEWKMRVVSDLRSIFPHLQFVATTHDPLCLRGLQPGELHLLERRDGTITIQQIDVPSGLDADEILTGSWFGLDTTLDPKVQADLLRYRNLRLAGHGPDDPAVADLQHRLELTLGSYTGTSLGRVMVEAAGELVAEQAAPAAPADTKLTKDQIKERLLAHARERTR